MGGLGGEVRAATKDEVWKKFENGLRSQVEAQFGLFLDGPLTLEAAFEKMWKDEKSGFWVLDIHFSK